MALINEYYFDTVVALGIPSEDNSVSYIATGFLYGYPVGRDEKRQKTYLVFLVTNRHVIEDATDIVVRFNAPTGTSSKTYRLPMGDSEQANHWTTHPDPNVDIAVLLIDAFLPKMEESGIKMSFVCEGTHIAILNELRALFDFSMLSCVWYGTPFLGAYLCLRILLLRRLSPAIPMHGN